MKNERKTVKGNVAQTERKKKLVEARLTISM